MSRGGEDARAAAAATHVLAVGKVALPMLRGLPPGPPGRRVLAVAPAALVEAAEAAGEPGSRAEVTVLSADHPEPSERSVAAAEAVLRFVREAGAAAAAPAPGAAPELLVLLSGGASSLLCAPAEGLGLDDKRAAVAAVARAGATIAELNVVRKHLSAIKGGRLAAAARAAGPLPITVLALSDVVGDDPATIASGPFSADPSTFADALSVLDRLAPALRAATARAYAHLAGGGQVDDGETPKPGDARLAGIRYRVLAGPRRVVDEAQRAAREAGLRTGVLGRDTELPVQQLAARYLERARRERPEPGTVRVLIGNGEPRITVPAGAGRGGRCSHLALLVAEGLAALPEPRRSRTAFLAAGTDDRDGNSDLSGAAVDGSTLARAAALGLDARAALAGHDSARPLGAIGDAVRGPGTSNLLDLHLLAIAG